VFNPAESRKQKREEKRDTREYQIRDDQKEKTEIKMSVVYGQQTADSREQRADMRQQTADREQ
jgi:hypothetical protein